jgi:hypothetical protein
MGKGGLTMAKVFGIHELELRPGVTPEQFEQFLREVVAKSSTPPPWTERILKGDRGARAGKFALLIELESVEARDRVFPSEGKLSGEVEQYLAATSAISEQWAALATMPGDSGTTWTDYVEIGAG